MKVRLDPRNLVWLWTVTGICADPGLYLGVQEPPVPDSPKKTFEVRVAFRKQQGKWEPMPHFKHGQKVDWNSIFAAYPEKLAWTGAFDGKRVLSYESLRPTEWDRLMQVGIHTLAPGAKPFLVQQGKAGFHTWIGEPEFRPIILVSKANYRDPDRWKPFLPDDVLIRRGVAAFRRLVPLDLDCEKNLERYNVPHIPIRAHPKAYRSARGDVLLNLYADSDQNCRGGTYGPWESAWILFHGSRETFVGDGLQLIDAGDYDADGVSEVMFARDAYDQDGYLLLLPVDGSTVEFWWHYH